APHRPARGRRAHHRRRVGRRDVVHARVERRRDVPRRRRPEQPPVEHREPRQGVQAADGPAGAVLLRAEPRDSGDVLHEHGLRAVREPGGVPHELPVRAALREQEDTEEAVEEAERVRRGAQGAGTYGQRGLREGGLHRGVHGRGGSEEVSGQSVSKVQVGADAIHHGAGQ
ncbi:hypothetical protein THAOC_22755, partial [Thalassiosira oceanica]